MLRHGWTLLFHEGVTLQLRKLQEAAARAEQNDPQGFESNANVKLFRALSHLIMEAVPADPGRDEFRQGNTLGTAYRHWRRAKIGRRFRLFFRYDSTSKSSSMHGSTTKIPYGPQAANPIPTPYSRRCWAAATLLMTGIR